MRVSLQAYIAVWMPWPFEAVGLLVAASGADMYDEAGCLAISFSTPEKDVSLSKASRHVPKEPCLSGAWKHTPGSC
mgnify:CR=1 FL=1